MFVLHISDHANKISTTGKTTYASFKEAKKEALKLALKEAMACRVLNIKSFCKPVNIQETAYGYKVRCKEFSVISANS